MHLSDSNPQFDCMLPLDGDFDFKKFLNEAVECGYTGDAVVEVYRAAFGEPQELFDSHKNLLNQIF